MNLKSKKREEAGAGFLPHIFGDHCSSEHSSMI